MAPAVNAGGSNLHYVDCAVGFHIGPAGACIIGVDKGPPPPPPGVVVAPPPPPAVVVAPPRVVVAPNDGGCVTKTVKRTNGEGDTATKTTTNRD